MTMIQFLAPVDAARKITQIGWEAAAKDYGMELRELVEFMETYSSRESGPRATGRVQLDLYEYFPDRNSGRYTPDKVRALLSEHSVARTADLLGIKVGTLRNYMSTHGIPARRVSPIPPNLAQEVQRAGVRGAASTYGVSVPTVYRWLQDAGIPTVKQSKAPDITDLKRDILTLSTAAVAEKYGVTHVTVANWARDYGLGTPRRFRMKVKADIIDMAEHVPLADAAACMGLDLETVKRILQNP